MCILDIAEVKVTYGGLTAVNNVSLKLEAGQICAIIGPNGAGKTTLFNAVSGHAAIDSGAIRIAGTPVHNLPPHQIAQHGVRRTFQNGGLFGELTVLENILVGMHAITTTPVLSTLLGLPRAASLERRAVQQAREVLALMDIGNLEDYPAKSLSGGQQRIVELVRAVASAPPLLLLDEPAVGLSPPMRVKLGENVTRLARERGIAILIIEHAFELVMNISDRVVVMSQGTKIADDTPAGVRANPEVLEAYLGHA